MNLGSLSSSDPILFCIHDAPGKIGGTYSWIRWLLPSLYGSGLPIHVLAFIEGEPELCRGLQHLRMSGLPCSVLDFKAPVADRVRWILEHAKKLNPSLVVANHQWEAYYAVPWLRKAGIPVLGLLHCDDATYDQILQRFGAGQKRRRLAAAVAVSEALAAKAKSVAPKLPVYRIPYGVHVPTNTICLPTSLLRIAYVGRLIEHQKQITAVTRALIRVVNEVPGTEALIIGNGAEEGKIRALVAAEAPPGKVKILGGVDPMDMPAILSTCHVVTLLSDYEGLPIAVMEAMAHGIVPVCLAIPSGIPELIRHQVTGLLVQDREDSFVKAIRDLRKDTDLFRNLSLAARALVQERYSDQVCLESWKHCLVEVSNSRQQKTKPIVIPHRPKLPPPHPALCWGDERPAPWWKRSRPKNGIRFYLGYARKKLFALLRVKVEC